LLYAEAGHPKRVAGVVPGHLKAIVVWHEGPGRRVVGS